MDFRTITDKRQFRGCIAMDRNQFDQLCLDLTQFYEEQTGRSYAEHVADCVHEKPKFTTLEDGLFFTLFQKKNDLIYDALGAVFGMNGSSAHLNYNKFNQLLEGTLKKEVMPMREAIEVEEFHQATEPADELLIDGTEMPTERPQDDDFQRQMYSGKKKTHTDAAVVISDKNRYIYYLSELYKGSLNDMGVLTHEFAPGKAWFTQKPAILDLGYVGVDQHYTFQELIIGNKRKRAKKGQPRVELTEAQKQHNREVSSNRIYVEHAIGRMKRYRVLKNRSRIKCYNRKNRELGICAGLANYKLVYRPSKT